LVLITARLDEATVKRLLDELLPARLLLGDEPDAASKRWLQIERASHVDFVAGAGLRVLTSGQIQWQTVGLPIGITMKSAQLMLTPEVAADEHGGRLVFRPALEALDLKNVPAIFDSGVLSIINSRLAAQGDDLAWHFGKTMALGAPLPRTFLPPLTFHLGAREGKVEVLEDAVVFSVAISLGFTRAPLSPTT
jgi:hypothetical protein